jgi:hypothetical protein
VVDEAVERLASLLFSCGVGGFNENVQTIRRHTAEKLGSLFTAARKLNKMTGEDVISEDLMVTVVGGNYLFHGEHMEDAYPGIGVKTGGRVVCTTDLGLYDRRGGKMLLKPKVLIHNY